MTVDVAAEAQALLDAKTKPRGSLGRLEELAVRIATVFGTAQPEPVRAAIVVAAADHGYAEEGVSAYPSEVTRQMLANFERGGAAICVLARELGAELVVRDVGVGAATANATRGPALPVATAQRLVEDGAALARELGARGTNVVAVGEMGIANTTAASAVLARLLDVDARAVCGAGTGLDTAGIAHKVSVVERALVANASAAEPLDVLAALGGRELAFLAGVALGAESERMLVLLDGFVVGAAALAAARMSPTCVGSMVAAHLSPEPGHELALRALGLEPLLDLRLRLGEATGAALVLPLVRAARAILVEMASFAEAGITDAGR
jgi:nicotinate-nucleotide--dimethylbenzimidazole phosphoribosyltransferase